MRGPEILLLAALALTACDRQPEGKPVLRTEIGSGKALPVGGEASGAAASASPTPAAIPGDPCTRSEFEGVAITECIADPAKHVILAALGQPPYRGFAKLKAAMGDEAAKVAFAVNAGMFDGEGKPIGYFVRNGDRRQELNRADGSGNFHMKPNGVFYGAKGKWHVRTSADFYTNVTDRPDFGTQSGPMLVIAGKLHPEFSEDGPSRNIRNGVGVDAQGRAHFAISEGPISFGSFARYFRDVAKTPDALYLDGNVSSLWDPVAKRMDARAPIGPMLVVERKD
ncbi:hypothetical protein F7D01_14385 [Erythrobacter sp. 3-20A1M]|uniref:phosphodiester glycosidase family protein n=1 Tax=Erythrobacter sp. 3-20A1M TaxID=2653850 RepID=UPI001BFC9F20|nr:phosphodiester glycosidase family protein [Erythrobacter sp. 3-20A1M]QWC58097.1 hypothetical protein F7D01_14385 [Erythrobacter sp. 3-20A1M]